MANEPLDCLVIEPNTPARAAVVWMHGLGADAHDFEPIVPELGLPPGLGVRFVFPNAPVQPVTINGGMAMPAWYDILSMDIPRHEDDAGVRRSAVDISAIVQVQIDAGIPAERIVLAGFSQGCAMALHTGLRYPQRLAGILGLSGYLPLIATVADERSTANADIPIFMAHGDHDPVIPIAYGRASAEVLQSLGYSPRFRSYPMQHQVCLEEIRDIGEWLGEVLE